MSGLPHPFTAPHGDALLPNRTGDGMNKRLREALASLSVPEVCCDTQARNLTPHIETFGRACYYAGIDEKERPNSDRGIQAGVKAMMEDS